MKKINLIGTIIVGILIVLLIFAGCNSKKIISETVVDKQFIEAHTEIVTEYKYKWNWMKGTSDLVPDIKTKVMPDEWKLYIKITFEDGTNKLEWISVDKIVFDKYEINENYVENYK